MNKKELITMFEEAKEMAFKYCDGSIWAFVGSLEAKLAYEAINGFSESENLEREKLMMKLRAIISELK